MLSTNQQHVVLLHGLGRDKAIMEKMAAELKRQGFCPHNLEYPSRKLSISALAAFIHSELESLVIAHAGTWHLVGHSLGAIIIRQLLAWNHPISTCLGRVVMLGPPNHGSEVVDFFSRFSLYARIYGPAGLELATQHNPYLASLPEPIEGVTLGIIAGNKTKDRLYSWFLLPGENDGKVTVASTRLAGMQQHIVLPVAHPCLPEDPAVIAHTLSFLQSGKF